MYTYLHLLRCRRLFSFLLSSHLLDLSETSVYATHKFLIQFRSLQRSNSSLETRETAKIPFRVGPTSEKSSAHNRVARSSLVAQPLSCYLALATYSTNGYNLQRVTTHYYRFQRRLAFPIPLNANTGALSLVPCSLPHGYHT